MFLDDVRPHLCPNPHHNQYKTLPPHHIQCVDCCTNNNGGRFVVDAYDIILNASTTTNNNNPQQQNDPFLSANLAHSYARWTGDIHVPCRIVVKIGCGKILPSYIETKLSHILKGIEILRALNHPFFVDNPHPLDKNVFKTLMDEYMSLIDKVCSSSPNNNNSNSETLALRVILTNMKSVFTEVDFFEQYFEVLVPYVQSRQPEGKRFFTKENNTNNNDPSKQQYTGIALYEEILKTDVIRNTFSKYCIPFDVVYVMALCFICGDDTNLVYNIVLDLGARLCTRFFYEDDNDNNNDDNNPFPIPKSSSTSSSYNSTIGRFIKSNITPRKNLSLYYFVKKFPDLVEECFSEDFVRHFGELDRILRNASPPYRLVDETNKCSKFEYQQNFPFILFEGKDEDYYSFVMALAYYASKTSSSTTTTTNPFNRNNTKGLISNCRKIYRFVKNCIYRIREFERHHKESTNNDIYWTRDTFNLFLCTDSLFEKELVGMLGMMLDSSSNDNI